MPIFGVDKFERFFRAAAHLEVDKSDLKRYSDFIVRKVHDLLLMGQVTAEANLRDVVAPHDLPITKGLQECIHAFRKMDQEIELSPILSRLAVYPPLDRALSEATEKRLPHVIGGLSLALARIIALVEPGVRNPQTEHWEKAFKTVDELT
ncbi:hypothetical protein Val02_74460 [Virgisporangium aliadipatigenens]|uniref:DUF1931 family protein n=1 Tax=Virgisporangium aliadipatigenens TaxID=741659 RepID=A0A8J4DTT3_9ACTN|nr:DUF1931 family protein [Virgisporangium aliadipatigenens]GIJ50560.1 hypothetical protein Val02_74460 [Virgisporangium aliadipatigenens]